MSKKNNIKVGLNGVAPEEGPVDMEKFEATAKKGSIPEKAVEPGILCSMVDHPITVKYGDEEIRVSGRARLNIADHSKLPSELPKGLVSKKL